LTASAIAKVKQTCIAVFAGFPDHESYDTIIQTVIRRDLEKAQAQVGLGLYRISACGHQHEKVHDRKLDVKEQFWVYLYNGLLTFVEDNSLSESNWKMTSPARTLAVTDFQINRTGPENQLRLCKHN
jgi:hypothetical protein